MFLRRLRNLRCVRLLNNWLEAGEEQTSRRLLLLEAKCLKRRENWFEVEVVVEKVQSTENWAFYDGSATGAILVHILQVSCAFIRAYSI